MAPRTIAIIQYGSEWRIVDQDGRRGDPQRYDEALLSADILARRARWQGLEVEILVHRDGELRGRIPTAVSKTAEPVISTT